MVKPGDPDDHSHNHYSTKHKIVAWVSQNLFDGVTYTARHGLLEGMKRKGGLGWVPTSLSGGSVETAEHKFWKSLDLSNLVVYDVGAFQGLLTLFFARQAKTVICYEPNTRNHKRLTENLALNNICNVTIRKMGAGSAPQDATMVFSQLMPGGASVEQSLSGQIRDSSSDILTEMIHITTIDQDIQEASLPAPDFIKIDIEGFEIEALCGAQKTLLKHFPALFLEMHGDTMNQKKRKVQEIVDFLVETGYQKIVHVESGTELTRSNAIVAAEGHVYCPRR